MAVAAVACGGELDPADAPTQVVVAPDSTLVDDAPQPTNTPAISLLYALEAQLQRIDHEGGPEGRWARHDSMRKAVEAWVAGAGGDLGYSYLPEEGRRSWTVSCLNVPEDANGRTITQAMKKEGWVIGSGYGRLKSQTIRIGHMGDHSVERVNELLLCLETVTA